MEYILTVQEGFNNIVIEGDNQIVIQLLKRST